MTIDRLNYLNIGLMALAGALAMLFPFQLFLFSYAVMGPLHYLTEISWLHDRGYFTKKKTDYRILLGMVVIWQLWPIVFHDTLSMEVAAIYLVFAAAAILTLLTEPRERRIATVVAILLLPAVLEFRTGVIIFAILLPTVIHVFVFTGAFLLFGALKSGKRSGVLSVAAFVAIAALLLLWRPEWNFSGPARSYVRSSYGQFGRAGPEGFMAVNYYLMQMIGFIPRPGMSLMISEMNNYLYENPLARSIMAFIAFAYTYHYLNWFSKTSVIGWHEMPRRRLWLVLAVWIGSLGLYAIDYKTGVQWLLFLSLLHVVLEFPLNHITFVGIGRELGRRGRRKPQTAKA